MLHRIHFLIKEYDSGYAVGIEFRNDDTGLHKIGSLYVAKWPVYDSKSTVLESVAIPAIFDELHEGDEVALRAYNFLFLGKGRTKKEPQIKLLAKMRGIEVIQIGKVKTREIAKRLNELADDAAQRKSSVIADI